MRKLLLATAIAALAACNKDSPTSGEPSGPIITPQQSAPANQTGNTGLSVTNAGDLPEPGPTPRFVGKWAEQEQNCQSAAWQFAETTVKTPAGSSCSFVRVTEVPGGYDVQATCTADGAPAPDTLKIRFAESAKALLLESKVLGDKGLVFCGRDV